MAVGFFNSEDTLTPEGIERRRKMAEMLMQESTSTAPVAHWTQGAARLLGGVAGKFKDAKLDGAEKANRAYTQEQIARLFGGGETPAAPMASAGAASTGASAPSRLPIMAGGSGAIPKPASFSGSQSEFVASMMPHAMKVSQETGLDPRLVIAQSALETGYGRSAPGNNFFGIKSHGKPGGNTMATTEVVNGQPVRINDSFRAYSGMGESAQGYAEFLKSNPRYKGVLGAQGLDAQIEAMARSGYATDPAYGQKLRQIASGVQAPATPPPVQLASAGGMTPDGMPTGPVPSNAPPMSFAAGQGQPPSPFGTLQPMGGAPPAGGMPAPGAVEAGPAPMPQMPQQQAPQPQQLAQALTGGQGAPPPSQGGPNRMAALAAFLTDPRVDKSTKAALGPLLAQQLSPRADFAFQVAGDSLYRVNKRTGMAEPIGAANKPTTTQREYEVAKSQGFTGSFMDYQTGLKKAGATNVNVNSGDNKFKDTIGTKSAELFMETAKEGTAARADVGRVRQLRTMVESLPGGFVGGAQAAASRYGIKLGPNAGNVEAAEAIINQLVPAQRPPGSGTMSDMDVQLFKSSLPSLSNTPQGNKIILDTMEAMAQYKAAQAEIASEVVTEKIDRNEGMRRLQALPDPFEAFKGFAGSQPAAAPAAPMPSAPARGTFSDDEIQAEMKRRGLL